MKIGIVQLNSSDDIQQNFSQIKKIILQAQSEQPKVLFFPENTLYFRINPDEAVQAISLDDKMISGLKDLCAKTQIAIHFTTPVLEEGKVFNASIYIDAQGAADVVYRKIHLFDIELSGQQPMRESDAFTRGSRPEIFSIDNFKIGSSICYDIRFAELYSIYAKIEVDIILVPAAFLVKTGQAHWEVLLRARAIESQCYVIAAAQSGVHQSKLVEFRRETFGHSMFVDPWGEATVINTQGVGIFFTELKQELIQSVRKQIPMKDHRRLI